MLSSFGSVSNPATSVLTRWKIVNLCAFMIHNRTQFCLANIRQPLPPLRKTDIYSNIHHKLVFSFLLLLQLLHFGGLPRCSLGTNSAQASHAADTNGAASNHRFQTPCQELCGTSSIGQHGHSRGGRVTFSFKMRSATCTTILAMRCSLLRSADPARYSRGNNAVSFRHDQVHPFGQTTSLRSTRTTPFSHPSHCPEESQDL